MNELNGNRKKSPTTVYYTIPSLFLALEINSKSFTKYFIRIKTSELQNNYSSLLLACIEKFVLHWTKYAKMFGFLLAGLV